MEPIGGIASVMALGGTAITVAKAGIKLARIIQDAPKDLQSIFAKVHLIQLHIDQLTQIGTSLDRDDDQLLSIQFRQTVQSALESTTQLLNKILEALPSNSLIEPRSRIKWALLDRRIIDKLTSQLPCVQQELGLAVQILDLRISLHLKESFASFSETQKQLVHQVSHLEKTMSEIRSSSIYPQDQQPNICKGDEGASNRKDFFHPVYQKPFIFSDYSLLKRTGLAGTIASYLGHEYTFYAIKLAFSLPWGFGSRYICIELMLKWHYSSQFRCQISRGLLSVKPLVPIESEILVACSQGDMPTAQRLFRERKASCNDITSCGRTPLMHAVKSGSHSLVKFLIEAGADVNCSYGEYQMSPLQLAAQCSNLDIVRLLLSNNADADHTDAQGWTAAFYLWSRLIQMPNQSGILKVLISEGDCKVGAVGCQNWTALHRASALGTSEDVRVMMQCGANPQVRVNGLDWSPLHYATLHDNDSVICELLRPEYNLNVNSPDIRGWTPLHIAASLGLSKALHTLLKLGADTTRLTKSTSFQVQPIFQGMELTAQEIAERSGQKNLGKYLDALNHTRFDPNIVGEKTPYRDDVEI